MNCLLSKVLAFQSKLSHLHADRSSEHQQLTEAVEEVGNVVEDLEDEIEDIIDEIDDIGDEIEDLEDETEHFGEGIEGLGGNRRGGSGSRTCKPSRGGKEYEKCLCDWTACTGGRRILSSCRCPDVLPWTVISSTYRLLLAVS